MKLLTESNTKTKKGEKKGYMTLILHLKPCRRVCPFASPGCMGACLNTAGRGAFSNVQEARQRKTDYYLQHRQYFLANLNYEILLGVRRAKRRGLKLAVRLNGTSDIDWLDVVKGHPTVQFYDYTKGWNYLVVANKLDNYNVVFSRSEKNEGTARMALEYGYNIAVVFRNELPKKWHGCKVIDGDETDLRFLEAGGLVVGLKAKGKAKKDNTGFVID